MHTFGSCYTLQLVFFLMIARPVARRLCLINAHMTLCLAMSCNDPFVITCLTLYFLPCLYTGSTYHMMQLCSQLATVEGLSFHLSAEGAGMPIFMVHFWCFTVVCDSSHFSFGNQTFGSQLSRCSAAIYIGLSSQVLTT